ncbi:GNAT family N-acetyltransferase [Zunongwangia sp. HGR-M22]|uniref:GNAT family N-acetyltransferase n=1 Tax=Zunongwangia sp. HGR-M22 TaxID=3015168 RepID=UPI0022DD2625|nr:GNAT family N-acetyltransferase [Zunongwangia sp. HGR-M22]WBL24590.1 GNAT family N-acetyltransferase [Zunongwangia sp. HGR-M22]
MEIISFEPQYSKDFKRLNIEWLEKYFYVEPHDEDVLGKPEEYIIKSGGQIFFVKQNEEIIGCVALMKIEENIFELTKMAISPKFHGKKIGQKLINFTIEYAKRQPWETLIIYSSRKLENALHIYKKFGFTEIPIEENNPYARGDIKMKLQLS